MKEKHWKWLRDFSNKKVRECYMARVYHDRKCDRCESWTSEVDGCKKLTNSECGDFELMTCNKCLHVSKWDCRGMMPTMVVTFNRDEQAQDSGNA